MMARASLIRIKHLFFVQCFVIFFATIAEAQGELPVYKQAHESLQKVDWLIQKPSARAEIFRSADGKEIILYNGLVRRSFRIQPNLACIDYKNLITGQQLIRRVAPEARIHIDGKAYDVGGLTGQKQNAYLLNEWLDSLRPGKLDFRYRGYSLTPLLPHVRWKPSYWSTNTKQPTGKRITFTFSGPEGALQQVEVHVTYDIYDGLPLIRKSLSIVNNSGKAMKIDRIVNEILATPEEESAVIGEPEQMKVQQGIYIESNYAFNNAMNYQLSDQTTHWKTDSTYTSQVNYNFKTPCLLEVCPNNAPGVDLKPGENLSSIHTYEMLMHSYDKETRGLAVRKMYRAIAPWTTGNPIFMHLVSRNDEEVKAAIDQCKATGYEALILSFGSHINMEDSSAANIQRWKSLAAYAHSSNIMIGGYSLFSSRRISDEDDVISPVTGKPGGALFGNAPCFGSKWGLAYRNKIKYFFQQTGFDIWENDGPYAGDLCASRSHPGHTGTEDSQWQQMKIQQELYRGLNEKGVYINAPDWYFLDGTNKIALGYREVNFSLPREQQILLNRQNIYDGTWFKTPSMSWGFVPLTRYQGGGPEAILEPLSEHLKAYEQLMMQYYGAGVQACYRGPRLYDTEKTKQKVIEVINWYKKYRIILNSDIIHLRRADGRDWDGFLHLNPNTSQKGLLMIFNPLQQAIERTIRLPLYYSGLSTTAKIREKEGQMKAYTINRDYTVDLKVKLGPNSYSWFVIE
jgi:hypothetical protein